MRKLLTISLLIFFTIASYAKEVIIQYTAGYIEYSQAGDWVELESGDRIADNVSLRLEPKAILEFSYADSTIVVNQAGTYRIQDLLAGSKEQADWNLGGVLGNKLTAMLMGGPETQTGASMGVRASEAADADPFEDLWLDDELNEEEFDQLGPGREYILMGNFDKSLTYLEKVQAEIAPPQANEYYYLLGISHLGLGQKAQALENLASSQPDKTAEYYPNYVVIRGKLLLDSLAFGEALTLFNTYLQAVPVGGEQQAVLFLSALCQYKLGDKPAALQRLEKAQKIDKTNQIAEAAGRWIETIKSNK